jgi:hypothetical protein
MIELGATVKDKNTGFSGKVTARIEYLNGSNQVEITSPDLHEGKPVTAWLQEDGVDVVTV